MVYGIFTASLLATLAACTPERENLLLDLERCTVDGLSFSAALRWESATIDFDSERYRRFEKLVARSAPFGVYYGVCGIDRTHGQAMLARLPDPETANRALPLETRPPLSRSTDRPKLERLFGPPNVKQGDASYKPVLHTDSSIGRAGEWTSICRGFMVKFTLDAADHLTTILISPIGSL
ncbi:MAG: hypothetical protein U9Q71_08375 [Pseudomonadota bacterium]|nr:hypothetical protein [Pseudomonadota bacterium]